MVSEHREWGDGATDIREHVIDHVSYEQGLTLCRCGSAVHTDAGPTRLKLLWDTHRGLQNVELESISPAALADDEEVQEFLEGLMRKEGDEDD